MGRKPGILRPHRAEVMLSPEERTTIDRVRGKTSRARFLRDAALLAAGEPFSPTFLRGLRARAPTNDETGLFELARLALHSKLPAIREAAQAELERALAHLVTTARGLASGGEERP